jgi:hypothetical protein
MTLIPTLRKLKQEDGKFEASLTASWKLAIVRHCLKNKTTTTKWQLNDYCN